MQLRREIKEVSSLYLSGPMIYWKRAAADMHVYYDLLGVTR